MEVLESEYRSDGTGGIKIKFHSIFHRFFLFIILFWLTTIFMLGKIEVLEFRLFNIDLTISRMQMVYIYITTYAITLIISFFNWKFYICKEGIYIRKIDLLVHWEDIVAVSHVWINEFSYSGGKRFFFYNRKTLVIYRKEYKPICIYNISLIALYVVKIYKPNIRVNAISTTLATIFNIILNASLIYTILFDALIRVHPNVMIAWTLLYGIKSLVLPQIMIKSQNKIHGKYLSHDKFDKKFASDAIHV